MVRLTDRPDTTLDVYRGRKTTMQQQQQLHKNPIRLVQCEWHSVKRDHNSKFSVQPAHFLIKVFLFFS